METLKRHWFRVPSTVRKPLVLIVGLLLVIISPFTGVLPGPGGIPVFLIGVAILSTEFEWAKRFRDWILAKLHELFEAWKRHKVVVTLILLAVFAGFIAASYYGFRWVRSAL